MISQLNFTKCQHKLGSMLFWLILCLKKFIFCVIIYFWKFFLNISSKIFHFINRLVTSIPRRKFFKLIYRFLNSFSQHFLNLRNVLDFALHNKIILLKNLILLKIMKIAILFDNHIIIKLIRHFLIFWLQNLYKFNKIMSFSSTKQAFNVFPKQNQKLFHNFSLAKKNFDGKFLLDLYTSSDLSSNYMKRRFLYQRKQKFKSQIKNSSRGQAKVDILKKSMIKENYQSISKQSSLKQSIIAAQKQYRKGRQTQQQEKIQEYGNYRAAKVHLLQKSMFISNEHRRRQTTKKKIDSMMKIRKSQPLMKTPLKVSLQQFLPLKKVIQEQFNTQQISQKKFAVQAQSITILKHNINIYSKQGERRKQIASLTKIMTCICVLYLSEKHQVSLQATEAKVSRNASTLGGTTANLKHGDVVFLIDLLYGMMLPSGNDAAQTLAQFFGRLIYKKSPDYLQRLKQVSKIQQALNFQSPQKKEFIYISSSIAITSFLNQMNGIAKYLQMEKTYFTNCHGLSDIRNKSCSNDVAKLCYHCMKNQKFREIVNKKIHQAKIFNKNTKMSRIQKWMNTNLNLNGKNCFGIKTGNTPNAGPCLASYFQDSSSQSDLQIIIVLIKAKSKASRFQQVQKMFEFFQKKLSCQQSSRRFQSFQQF